MFWRPEYLLLLSASVASFEDEVGSGGLPELDNLADLLGNHYGLYLSAYTTAKAASTQAKKRAEDTSMAYKKAALKVAALKQELKDAEKVMLLSEETMRRAKQEKLVADKKYKDCVTNMAHNIIKAGGGELDMPDGEEVPEVILYSAEDFSGKSFSLDKLDESIDFKYWSVKSIKISNALLFASLEDQGDELSYSFSGSVRKIADYIPFGKKCCDRIRLRTPPNTNAVELYSEPNFKGRKVSFLGAGDYDVEAEIQSVRVAAGYRLYLFRGDAQAGYLDMFLHDNAVLGDTNSRPARRRTQKIRSIRVKNDRPDVVRALLMIDDREQSFPADPGVYLLPRWGAISAIHIPMTAEAEFRLRDGTTIAAINGSAPPANATHVDVRGKCGPDYCGVHGRCVGPDECRCSGGFSGNRCTIQFPDSSSSIVCDSAMSQRSSTILSLVT